MDGHFAKQAVFCKVAFCFNGAGEPEETCNKPFLPPVPIPVGPPLTLVNVGHFANIIGNGAICYEADAVPESLTQLS
ncbi:hypothetical protein K435DRAFT_865448 [Dendrothele bispora CBS 962.96]|uniref:Uncharacterized protein n=1 Tax=Dendrothele bispora (strain CBS 962.96) TaxID=1314807 RepID=A0A4S8LJK0_DENBC|nr:hypothetical protein K435DRAFT_865448 [Dendrothele bispora CBS 962.96]